MVRCEWFEDKSLLSCRTLCKFLLFPILKSIECSISLKQITINSAKTLISEFSPHRSFKLQNQNFNAEVTKGTSNLPWGHPSHVQCVTSILSGRTPVLLGAPLSRRGGGGVWKENGGIPVLSSGGTPILYKWYPWVCPRKGPGTRDWGIPLWTDTCLWKHYLPHPSGVGGNNAKWCW